MKSGTRRNQTAAALIAVALMGGCGGGGGGGDGGCTQAAVVQLTYKDSRIPASTTSFSTSNLWFASLDPIQFNPIVSEVCGAATTYRIASGSLPAGVTLNTATGVIAGVPEVSGDRRVTVGVRIEGYSGEALREIDFIVDDFGFSYPAPAVLNIGDPVSLTPTINDGFTQDPFGQPGSNATRGSALPAGATTAYTVASGSLPPGVTLNASTGVISGAPTAAGVYLANILLVASKDGRSTRATGAGTVAVSFTVN